MQSERESFFSPDDLINETTDKINQARANGAQIDYLTVVPDGEPTLDSCLGELLDGLNATGIRTAVITNSTLLDSPDVRSDLSKASWVSVKVDAASEMVWRKVDRPLKSLNYDRIKEGLFLFSQEFTGILAAETMLVKGLNDSADTLRKTASFIALLQPSIAYISIPTRPPAESWAVPPEEDRINEAFQLFTEAGLSCEYLIGYEGNQFSRTGDVVDDLLSITSVHPMREEAVLKMIREAGESFSLVEELIKKGRLVRTSFEGHIFYLRKLKNSDQKER